MSEKPGQYQIWHADRPPPEPDEWPVEFPEEYTRVAVVQATSLSEAVASTLPEEVGPTMANDIIVDPEMRAYTFDGAGFSVLPYRNTTALSDREQPDSYAEAAYFTAALLDVDRPTPEQIERIVGGQVTAYYRELQQRGIDDWGRPIAAESRMSEQAGPAGGHGAETQPPFQEQARPDPLDRARVRARQQSQSEPAKARGREPEF